MADQYRAGLSRIKQSGIINFIIRYRVILCTIFFGVVTGVLILHHEPWRDEAQSWLIARDVPNIIALLRMGGYEGTPMLWHLLLWPFAHSGLPFFSEAVLNWLFAVGAAYLFLSRAPFTFFQRILFISGYFVAYEYSVIARSYALFVFLLFLCAVLYRRRFDRPLRYGCALFFLAQATVFGTIMSCVLAGAYVFEYFFLSVRRFDKRLLSGFLVVGGVGIVLGVAQMMPPADLNGNLSHFRIDSARVVALFIAPIAAFVPIPAQRVDFWTMPLLFYKAVEHTGKTTQFITNSITIRQTLYQLILICGMALYPLSILFVRRIARLPFFIYLISSLVMMALFFLKYFGGVRHGGLVFIAFIFSLWVASYYVPQLFQRSGTVNIGNHLVRVRLIITTFLLLQVFATPIAYTYELMFPFSSARTVRNYLVEEKLMGSDTFIATHPATYATTILLDAPLSRTHFFSLEDKEERSFMLWNRAETIDSFDRNLSAKEVVGRFERAFFERQYTRGILILHDKESRNISKELFGLFKPLGCMGHYQTISDETYCLYKYAPSSDRRSLYD